MKNFAFAAAALSLFMLIFGSAGHADQKNIREFSTDRPDKTESAYTVPAGHFQIETDIVTFTQDKSETAGLETNVKSFGFMVSNFKAGLSESTDLQIIVAPHLSTQTELSDSSSRKKNGYGDILVRVKYNLFGNDSGPVAMAFMPFIKIPTQSGDLGNDKLEGGLIIPIALALPNEWGMGIMAQVNRTKNKANDLFHNEFISTFAVGHPIVGALSGYVEFFSLSSEELDAAWVATFDAGLTYMLTPSIQLDAGANVGLTRAADDLNPFLGISARF